MNENEKNLGCNDFSSFKNICWSAIEQGTSSLIAEQQTDTGCIEVQADFNEYKKRNYAE